MSVSSQDEYQLGPIHIKGRENILVTDNGEIVVLPKVMALLLYLCQRSQEVVTFDELNTAIWPREVVGDNAIYNLVGKLRKALGDNASNPVYIQTVSKVGYRLLVDAEPIETVTPPSEKDSPESELNTSAKPDTIEPGKSQPVKSFPGKPGSSAWLLTLVVSIMLIAIVSTLLLNSHTKQQSPEGVRQLQLAYYQLYRGDKEGVEQAIETLQQIIATEPQWSTPKIELAYAFVRKAGLEPENKAFWMSKAHAISRVDGLGEEGLRLAALLNSLDNPSGADNTLHKLFEQSTILTSARLAYADFLFDRGNTKAASIQAKMALDNCMDCPYVYRKYATTEMVLGNEETGFESFSRYRMLINRISADPADITGFVPLTMQSLKEMVNWHLQTPVPDNLLPHQRNNLALFYLTLGQIEKAEAILGAESHSSEQFFDLYTHAAIAGAKGDFESSYTLLDRRQINYPNNQRFKLATVYALWQLGRYDEAMQAFQQHQILDTSDFQASGDLPDILPFPTWSLYAALLKATGDMASGDKIFAILEQQLKAGTVPGSREADIRLASVLAMQGKHQEALKHLEIAIAQGWVSDFNRHWWYLQDSPYFKEFRDDVEFKRIVALYHEKIAREYAPLH